MWIEHPKYNTEFLSTPSARRATGPGLDPSPGRIISIHALREEGDSDSLLATIRPG